MDGRTDVRTDGRMLQYVMVFPYLVLQRSDLQSMRCLSSRQTVGTTNSLAHRFASIASTSDGDLKWSCWEGPRNIGRAVGEGQGASARRCASDREMIRRNSLLG